MKKRAEYGKNVCKKRVNERKFQANLEEYESDILDQTLSQFNAFKNSVILPCILLTSNGNESSQNQGLILLVFSEVLKFPELRSGEGSFSNFWKPPWYWLILLIPMRVPIQTVWTCDISNLFQVSPVYFVQLQTRSQCFSASSWREEEGPLQTGLVQFTRDDVMESLFDINITTTLTK